MTGCSSIHPKILAPVDVSKSESTKENPARKLVVFFDGTANDETSDTNIKKLHSLITLQPAKNDKNISTFYVEGVGVSGKVIGMAMGWGTGYRVRLAYQYLAENYRKGDQIYLFGFSRGAYQARILASLLYHAGLPEQPLSKVKEAKKGNEEFSELVYDAFKGKRSSQDRKQAVLDAVTKANTGTPRLASVEVRFMGLWDTVEALGLPDFVENFINPNLRYGDQLCNVKRAAHALALDDDRARIFTPILLTREDLLRECVTDVDGIKWEANLETVKARLNKTVEEVWFTGAHADVGGGYTNGLLSGVSLNWMISQIQGGCKDEGLLPPGSRVPEDPDEMVHDPEAGLLWGTLYHERGRRFTDYVSSSPYNDGKMKVHSSVLTRLQKPERAEPPNSPPRESQWRLPKSFSACFFKNNNKGCDYKKSAACMLDEVPPRPILAKQAQDFHSCF